MTGGLFAVESTLMLGVYLLGVVLAVWALADAAYRPAAAFVAGGKWSKPGWVAVLAVAALVLLGVGVLSLFGLVAVVASIVYLVDVRPVVRELRPGSGPYG